jgi:hypothetical protein
MERKHPRIAWTVLLLGASVLSGCGWFDSDTPASVPLETPAAVSQTTTQTSIETTRAAAAASDPKYFSTRPGFRTPFSGPFVDQALDNIARGALAYDIYNVDPDQGTLIGGTRVHLSGVFPAVANATQIYTVYFGYNAATYDTGIPNIASAFNTYDIYVITPPGDMPGLVDVALIAGMYDVYAFEPLGYEYLDPFAITDIIPNQGIIAGGTAVEVRGRFPLLQSLNSIAAANQYYEVRFGSSIAPFRVESGFLPVVSGESIYVTAPPSPITDGSGNLLPGLVDVSVIDKIYGMYRTYTNGYRYGFEITDLQPNQGHYYGGNRVRILGDFLVANGIYDLASARSHYTVYFGDNVAEFDVSILPDPLVSAHDIYVIAPQASVAPNAGNPHVVDVEIRNKDGLLSFARTAEIYKYYYFTEMKVDFLIPRVGPLSGDTQVDVYGTFPVAANMYLNSALNHNFISIFDTYKVIFDVYDAFWDIARAPLPLIEINQTYAGYVGYFDVLHMRSPAGFLPGLVDIAVGDLSLTDPPAKLIDGYEYQPDSSIGSWIDCDVFPNPVGKLDAGELRVRIITGANGFFDQFGDRTVVRPFIVPQGGNPNNENHRIDLELIAGSINNDNGEVVSEWTNVRNINTEIFTETNNDVLYADGHAAVYILEELTIVGDDFFAPYTDSGLISQRAHEGRHFIIDTIPPQMFIATSIGANLNADDANPGAYTVLAPQHFNNWYLPWQANTGTHPQHVDGLISPGVLFEQFETPFPFSAPLFNPSSSGIITQIPEDNPEGAQRFFNVASLSNHVAANRIYEPFELTVSARFVDLDIHTYVQVFDPLTGDFDPNTMLVDNTTALDQNLFTGSTKRQVAGFSATQVVTNNDLRRLTRSNLNNLLLARWELQPGSTRLPEKTIGPPLYADSRVTFTGFGDPDNPNNPGGELQDFVYTLNEVEAFEFMEAAWEIQGIDPDEIDDFMRLIIKFSASDRANVYYPLGNTAETPKGLYTEEERQLDPLQIWWMREANTRFTRTNVPTSGVVRVPRFEWEITGVRPQLVSNDNNPVPLSRYSLWRTDQNSDPDAEFNETYFLATNELTSSSNMWSDWSTQNSLFPTTLLENHWYLLVVNSVDEAGNTESFPDEWIMPITLDRVDPDSSAPLQGTNWRRFFIEPRENQVDTIIDPIIWHDSRNGLGTFGTFQPNEPKDGPFFNDEIIIPLPSITKYNKINNVLETVVSAEFTISSNITDTNVDLEYEYSFEREGLLIDSGTQVQLYDLADNPIPVTYLLTDLGDSNRQAPVNYIFRATAIVNRGTSQEFRDTTPAQIRFVVVPNVEQYIRQPEGNEPFKEFERP